MAFKSVNKLVAGKIFVLSVITVLLSSLSAYSQYEYSQPQQQEEEPPVIIHSEDVRPQERPLLPDDNLQNAIQPSVNDIRSQQEEVTVPPPSPVKPNNPQARPGTGIRDSATVDDRDPAGNPDVPFDENMNLVFLITSLASVFGFVVLRKKFKLKPMAAKAE